MSSLLPRKSSFKLLYDSSKQPLEDLTQHGWTQTELHKNLTEQYNRALLPIIPDDEFLRIATKLQANAPDSRWETELKPCRNEFSSEVNQAFDEEIDSLHEKLISNKLKGLDSYDLRVDSEHGKKRLIVHLIRLLVGRTKSKSTQRVVSAKTVYGEQPRRSQRLAAQSRTKPEETSRITKRRPRKGRGKK